MADDAASAIETILQGRRQRLNGWLPKFNTSMRSRVDEFTGFSLTGRLMMAENTPSAIDSHQTTE